MIKVKCPKCGGDACLTSYGRMTGTATGIAVGAVTCILACASTGAKAGADKEGVPGLIVGATAGAVAGFILSFLASISTAGFIGEQAGALVDENLIRVYRCAKCEHEFRM